MTDKHRATDEAKQAADYVCEDFCPQPGWQAKGKTEEPRNASQDEEYAQHYNQISRWKRFEKWIRRWTLPEALTVLFTAIIAGATLAYTIYAQPIVPDTLRPQEFN